MIPLVLLGRVGCQNSHLPKLSSVPKIFSESRERVQVDLEDMAVREDIVPDATVGLIAFEERNIRQHDLQKLGHHFLLGWGLLFFINLFETTNCFMGSKGWAGRLVSTRGDVCLRNDMVFDHHCFGRLDPLQLFLAILSYPVDIRNVFQTHRLTGPGGCQNNHLSQLSES